MRPISFRFLVVPAFLLAFPLLAVGDRPSHNLDPADSLPKDIAKLLDARLGKGKLSADNAMLKSLMDSFKGSNGKLDPSQFDPELIRKLIESNPQLQDPDTLDRLRKLVEQQKIEPPDPKQGKVDWKNIDETLKKMEELQSKSKFPMPKDPKTQVGPNDAKKDPADPSMPERPDQPKKSDNEKQIEEFSRWVQQNLGNSPATQALARDFAKLLTKEGENGGAPKFLKDLEKEFRGLAGSKGDSSINSDIGKLMSGLKLPNLSSADSKRSSSSSGPPPSMDSGSGRSSSPSGGSSGMGNVDASGWFGPLLLALLALGAFYYWYKFLRIKPETLAAAPENTKPWPVDPLRVATREDVVKAFDHLSVTRCGDVAANWHHHQVANDLIGKQPDKTEAVHRLAGLYEKARYAPANDLFSDTEIAEARARLCLIAGVATA